MVKHTVTTVATFLLLTVFTQSPLVARIPDRSQLGLPSVTTDPALISPEEFRHEQAMQQQHIRNNELINAVIAGNMRATEDAINQGADVNVITDSGWTPLTLACTQDSSRHAQIVLLLLSQHAKPNKTTRTGLTPLGLACKLNQFAYSNALALLNGRANPNTPSGPSKTLPLHTAFFKNNQDVVELLLQYGAKAKRVLKICPKERQDNIAKLLRAAAQRQSTPSPTGVTNFDFSLEA